MSPHRTRNVQGYVFCPRLFLYFNFINWRMQRSRDVNVSNDRPYREEAQSLFNYIHSELYLYIFYSW